MRGPYCVTNRHEWLLRIPDKAEIGPYFVFLHELPANKSPQEKKCPWCISSLNQPSYPGQILFLKTQPPLWNKICKIILKWRKNIFLCISADLKWLKKFSWDLGEVALATKCEWRVLTPKVIFSSKVLSNWELSWKFFPHPLCYQWMLDFPFVFSIIPPAIASESVIKFLIAN